MAREIEMKFRLPDPARLAASLPAHGATRLRRVLEVNRLFDRPDGRLRAAGCGLRVRSWRSLDAAGAESSGAQEAKSVGAAGVGLDRAAGVTSGGAAGAEFCCAAEGESPRAAIAPRRSGAELTFKGPREPGPAKIREELELGIDDADALAQILPRLGFVEVVSYEKRRETWRLDGCEIELDELPQLGWFVEVEGPALERVQAVCDRLGLSADSSVSDGYPALVRALLGGDASPARLSFE